MKNVCMRSVLRQPGRYLALFLVLALAAWAFLSQTLQYFVLGSAVGEIRGYYRAVADFSAADGADAASAQDVLAALESSSYGLEADLPRHVPAEMDGIYSADIYAADIDHGRHYIYGDVRSATVGDLTAVPTLGYVFGADSFEDSFEYFEQDAKMLTLVISNAQQLAGMPEQWELITNSAGEATLFYYSRNAAELEALAEELNSAGRVLCSALVHGTTYQFGSVSADVQLAPMLSGEIFTALGPGETPDLAAPEYARLAGEVELLNTNLRSAYLYTTRDMELIDGLQDDYILREGRLLTEEDYASAAGVCVISSEMAQRRGLAVGDELKLTLWDTPSGYYGIRQPEEGSWRDYTTYEALYEVAGIVEPVYREETEPYYSRAQDCIFVPDSTVPAGLGTGEHQQWLSELVAELDNPAEQEAFSLEMGPVLAALGVELSFRPNNLSSFEAAAGPLTDSAAVSALLFAAVALASQLLAVFIHCRMRSKELVLLRAFGVPKRRVLIQGAAPLALLALFGTGLGAAAAYGYGLEKAAETVSRLETEYTVAVSFEEAKMLLMAAVVWAVLLAVLCAALHIKLSRPLIGQLQGPDAAAKRLNVPTAATAQPAEAPRGETGANSEPAERKHRKGYAWMPRYISRRLTRQPVRVLLSVLLAVLAICGLAFVRSSITSGQERIDTLYSTVSVEGEIVAGHGAQLQPGGGFMSIRECDALMETDAVSSVDRCAAMIGYMYGSEEYAAAERRGGAIALEYVNLLAAEREESAAAEGAVTVTGADGAEAASGLEVAYARGVDAELFFSSVESGLLLESSLAERLGVAAGDSVELFHWSENSHRTYTVAGVFTGSARNGANVIMSYESARSCFFMLYVNSCRFAVDPEYNRELDGVKLGFESGLGEGLELLIDDGELTRAVQPLERGVSLLQTLYPLLRALSAALFFGLAALLISLNSLEGAVLRVLGVSKGEAALTLAAEQILSAMAGAAVAVALTCSIAALDRSGLGTDAALCILGNMAGSLAAAAQRVSKRPLELLQVKE